MKMAASRPRGHCFFTLVAFNSLFIGLFYYKKDRGWNLVLNDVFLPQPPQPSNPLIARSANNCNSFELNVCQLTSGDGKVFLPSANCIQNWTKCYHTKKHMSHEILLSTSLMTLRWVQCLPFMIKTDVRAPSFNWFKQGCLFLNLP